MKIEKINDNQIRCYLSKEDLASRHMKLSELAYGTENAKRLFKEMIGLANKEYGFEAEDLPLMIEAVPLPGETILLTVTKVAFPDELDSRFASFSDTDMMESFHGGSQGLATEEISYGYVPSAKEIINVCSGTNPPDRLTRHFVFSSLDEVIAAAKVIGDSYSAINSLYKYRGNRYHLILDIGNHSAEIFNKVCNHLAEYGIMYPTNTNYTAKIIEHGKLISSPHALSDLNRL